MSNFTVTRIRPALALLGTACVLMASTSVATAAPDADPVQVLIGEDLVGYCLDAAAPNGSLQPSTLQGDCSQALKWGFEEEREDGPRLLFSFRPVINGAQDECLTWGNPATEAPVTLTVCSGADSQMWTIGSSNHQDSFTLEARTDLVTTPKKELVLTILPDRVVTAPKTYDTEEEWGPQELRFLN